MFSPHYEEWSSSSSDVLTCLCSPLPTGLSPDLQSMEQIRRIMRPTDVPDTGTVRQQTVTWSVCVMHGSCLCVSGLLCDLLWSDPDKDVQGWGENDRGVSFTFGADVVSKFLNRHDLDLICRAHQVTKDSAFNGNAMFLLEVNQNISVLQITNGWLIADRLYFQPSRPLVFTVSVLLHALPCQVVEDGYEFFAKRQLVTLFSAPNYCGEFDNAGGMMSVDESLMCSFQVTHRPFMTVRLQCSDIIHCNAS